MAACQVRGAYCNTSIKILHFFPFIFFFFSLFPLAELPLPDKQLLMEFFSGLQSQDKENKDLKSKHSFALKCKSHLLFSYKILSFPFLLYERIWRK